MEQEKKTVEKSGIGTVKIADEVVTLIVAYAALDVDGVAYIAGNVDRAILSKGGVRKLGKNVKVDVSKNGVKAELAIILEYGYNIPATSSKVQKRIKTAVETMTGLKVLDVDIRIAGINIPE
ncbi:MAG TPA: Asp23/Gls24 family envelope stress response protein [Lachnospiraceae bacterium]|nr:Asp23/Gls24 family envelope stress response protein [Lachnospiraceae bacterium]